MTKTITCAGPCARVLPKDEEHFQHRTYSAKKRAPKKEYWDPLCRACRHERDLPARLAARARRRAELAARKVVVCRGPCGKEKPYTDRHFRSRGDKKLLPTTCRVCDGARIAEWRASPRGRAMDRDRKRPPTPTSRVRNRAAAARWRAKVKVRPGGSAKQNALARLWDAVRRGDVERPGACQRCRTTRRRIVAHLVDGNYPGPVRWLCTPCRYLEAHPEVAAERREVGRDLAGIRVCDDPLRALTVPKDEWRAIHEAHLAEAPGGLPGFAEAVAGYRAAFRKVVLGRGAEGRLRRAFAIQPPSTQG